jgi:hypothetical protein
MAGISSEEIDSFLAVLLQLKIPILSPAFKYDFSEHDP